jgi:acetyltransferase-like isoleucine patch superfamily enzyme
MYKILGNPEASQLNKPLQYFQDRDTFLDCRGKIVIDETAMLGYNITIFTESHNKDNWQEPRFREVRIGKNCFIGSNTTLYNCVIGDNSIVAIGSVVRSRDVPLEVIVEGNPAVIIKRKVAGKWIDCEPTPLKLKNGGSYAIEMPESEVP